MTTPHPTGLTRRHLITGASALAASTWLAGCGTTSNNPSTTPTTTRHLKDYFGDVTVPEHPQRVIASDFVTCGHMASLGITPIAAGVSSVSGSSYLKPYLNGTQDISEGDNISIEKALSLNPDLMITPVGERGDLFWKDFYNKAKGAMTTFGYLYGYSYIEYLNQCLRDVATALNRSDAAETAITKYTQRVAALRQRVIAGKLQHLPVTTLRIGSDSYSIRMGTSESIAFRALGMSRPKGQDDIKKFSIDVSLENLELLNQANTLFLYSDKDAAANTTKLTSSALWKSLTPVKNNRVVTVDSSSWNGRDHIALGLILDDIEKGFIAAHGA